MNPHGAGAEALLVIGIGNSGRGDDGLGWAFLDGLQAQGACDVACEYRYQLQVEDAERISHARSVLFVDASREPIDGGFELKDCRPQRRFEFSTHALAPAAVLHLCQSLYGRYPRARVLAIEGRRFELGASMSAAAERHLRGALQHFRREVAGAPAGQAAALCQE